MYLVGFPLLLIPFAIYNIVAFLTPGVGWGDALTRLDLPSGGVWTMSLGDMLVALAILLLLVEIVKAYRSGGRYLMDHLLSALLLVAMAAEFYLVARAATATFFLLLVASFADVCGGLIAMRRHPRPVAAEAGPAAEPEPELPPAAAPAPQPGVVQPPPEPEPASEPASVIVPPVIELPAPAETPVEKPAADKPVG
jgi:hypothetical protein